MDHAGTFAHTANSNGGSVHVDLYCYLLVLCIGSHNSLGSLGAFLQAVTKQWRHSLYTCCDLVDWKLHTDDTGRSN